MKKSFFIFFVFFDILICLLSQFFFKENQDVTKGSKFISFEKTQNYTNLVASINRINDYLISSSSVQQQQQQSNELDISYTCSFLNKKPALQFTGSTGVYFIGEYCPYGRILTITPYRVLVKRGKDYLVLNNVFASSRENFIDNQVESNSHSQTNSFNFFGK